MKMLKKMALLFCVAGSMSVSAQLQETSFHAVRPTDKAPVIDGKILEDPVWQKAEKHDRYYVYLNQSPGPAKTRTESRMLYDDKGLYLAVINWGDSTKLKANITRHDDSSLWTDDCAEIYIDKECNGLAFRKFMVNSKGVIADMMRFDPQNDIDQWSAMGWINKSIVVKAPGEDRQQDYWTIESFIPWEDLGGKPEKGDLWSFCHTRFAMGIWQLSTSSPGGGYYNTARFGRIYFAPDMKPLREQTVAELLNSKTPPPWCVQIGDTLWKNEGRGIEHESMNVMVKKAVSERSEMLEKVKKEIGNTKTKARIDAFEKLEKAVSSQGDGLGYVLGLDNNRRELRKLYWELQCDKDYK